MSSTVVDPPGADARGVGAGLLLGLGSALGAAALGFGTDGSVAWVTAQPESTRATSDTVTRGRVHMVMAWIRSKARSGWMDDVGHGHGLSAVTGSMRSSLVVGLLLSAALSGCAVTTMTPPATSTPPPSAAPSTASPTAPPTAPPPSEVAVSSFEPVPSAAPDVVAHQPVVTTGPDSWTILPVSPNGMTVGVLYAYELPTCLPTNPVDVDGSFWDTVRDGPDTAPFEGKAGTFLLTNDIAAIFELPDGHQLGLLRHNGAKEFGMC